MRDAVLHDLGQLADVQTLCTHDMRLPAPRYAHQTIPVTNDPWSTWMTCMAEADAVLPIAPESANALLKLTQVVLEQGKLLLGCGTEGVKLAGSKLATCRVLQTAGIAVVPTWPAEDFPINEFEHCVVKPDDGVGGEGNRIFRDGQEFQAWREMTKAGGFVAQPYVQGTPASISMLCRDGQAWLLSCNLQNISVQSGQFIYQGSLVNGAADHWEAFEHLAKDVARAIPALSGYIGIDVLMHAESITVLEINPRLTTSYAGLHRAMGCNPAGLLFDLLYNSCFSSAGFRMPATIQRNEVDVALHG